MLKIAICDDEEYYRYKILDLLNSYFDKKGISYNAYVYDSGLLLMQLGENVRDYDIVFLDVIMKDLDGIETAKRIRTYTQDTFIVFVSEYIRYSLEGYKVNAIRYLLKDDNSIKVTLSECLDAIIAKMNEVEIKQFFEFMEGTKEVILDNILFIESNLHKLFFYIMNKKIVRYTMNEKLDALVEQIPFKHFCRIHKSYFVNLKYVVDLQRYKVVLTNGQEINVAKTRYKNVEREYQIFQGAI